VEEVEDFGRSSLKEAIFHVTKFESRVEELEDDIDIDVVLNTTEIEEESEEIKIVDSNTAVKTKTSLQKLSLQMLRTMVIQEEICADPSKFKKLELIQMVLDAQII
jgi:hypothetical protein